MLVLLDLNFTLARVEHGDKRALSRRIPEETYREWIPELCAAVAATVVLTTARPDTHRDTTLARIRQELDWQPHDAFFAQGSGRPPTLKEANLQRIIAAYGQPNNDRTGRWVGLESNPRTRDMYTRYGIYSLPVPREGRWESFPDVPDLPARPVLPFGLP